MAVRKASHAGSWYSDSASDLSRQLASWLRKAEDVDHSPARAIIAPHAGYRYSGECAAYAYQQVNPELVKRVFILGPSHHARLSKCALTSTKKYKTPLYDLDVDLEVINDLESSGNFEFMSLSTDEKEHSLEMHLPFIAKVMENYKQFKIVPILVGSVGPDKQTTYGKIFANYLADSQNLFVISSDFCHWGPQFRYTYHDSSYANIYESIENLDRMGMTEIEKISTKDFSNYLQKYGNTICGRYPILILLQTLQELQKSRPSDQKLDLKFLKYAQSNQCVSLKDSSVSYAAASLVIN